MIFPVYIIVPEKKVQVNKLEINKRDCRRQENSKEQFENKIIRCICKNNDNIPSESGVSRINVRSVRRNIFKSAIVTIHSAGFGYID